MCICVFVGFRDILMVMVIGRLQYVKCKTVKSKFNKVILIVCHGGFGVEGKQGSVPSLSLFKNKCNAK